jgi:hypothetical protein
LKKSELIKKAIEENSINKEEVLENIIISVQRDEKKDSKLSYRRKDIIRLGISFILALLIISAGIIPRFSSGKITSDFSLVVYASDSSGKKSEIVMEPNIQIGIAKYSLAMSSVPGFPFKYAGQNIKSVEFSADHGKFILWGSDYKITEAGKSVKSDKDKYVYWSPVEGSNAVNEATLTVTIKTENKKTIKKTIKINSDNEMFFYGTLVE